MKYFEDLQNIYDLYILFYPLQYNNIIKVQTYKILECLFTLYHKL